MKWNYCVTLFIIALVMNLFCNAHCEESIILEDIESEKLNYSQPSKTLKGSLLINDDKVLEELINLQKEKDLADIETLWRGTVENNKVIEFALKKLATPESQRRIHSSLMAKTLSAIISGTSFVPSIVGADDLLKHS